MVAARGWGWGADGQRARRPVRDLTDRRWPALTTLHCILECRVTRLSPRMRAEPQAATQERLSRGSSSDVRSRCFCPAAAGKHLEALASQMTSLSRQRSVGGKCTFWAAVPLILGVLVPWTLPGPPRQTAPRSERSEDAVPPNGVVR